MRMEPPMSEPNASVVIPIAKAAADPPDEPPALLILVTHSRARMERAGLQGVTWPHRRRANFHFYLFAGGVAAIGRSIDGDRPLRLRAMGSHSRAPGWRSSETAALLILVTHSRARMERAGLQGVTWPH